MATPKAPHPTELNLWVLEKLFGSETRVPNRLPPTDVPHIRRCMKAGLLVAYGRDALALTETGRAALAARLAKKS